MIFKQTWWDDNLSTRMDEFKSWIGSSNEPSKKYLREYVKKMGYKTIIDLGCGTATEYFAYKQEQPNVKYLGIDSSKVLYDINTAKGVPMVLAPAEDTHLIDKHSDFVFSRHVLEHQPDFGPILYEMIRLARKEAVHIFFIPPGETGHIGYAKEENLYHNRYEKKKIEHFLLSRGLSFNWVPIGKTEVALHIKIKE